MALFSRLKQSFEATKESYEAGAAKAACLLLAGAFALAAAVVWFVQLFGANHCMPVFHGRILIDRPKRWISKQGKRKRPARVSSQRSAVSHRTSTP